jgi:hypothetical protein
MEEVIQRQARGLDNSDREWYAFQAGKIGEETAEPSTCPISKDVIQPSKLVHGSPETEGPAWQLKLGKDFFRAGYLSQRDDDERHEGLWHFSPGQKPKLITEGGYSSPIVTQDGKRIIAGKYVWKERDYTHKIVRIDLKTNREERTSVPVLLGDSHRVIGEILDTGKVLVCRVTGNRDNEEMVDCLLLNVATGKTEKINGEFRPLQQQTFRSLQATAVGKKFWASIPDRQTKHTKFGVYDATNFTFTSLLDLPDIEFDSMQMWVDESTQKIYIAYNGHLLRLPLPKQ